MGTVKVLKCIPEDRGNDFNDYKYPKWEGKPIPIECEDWNPNPECGGGFHGITKNINDFPIFSYGPIYQVMEVDDNPDNFVIIDNEKVKFHKGNIIYQGKDAYKALKMIFDNDEEMVKWNGISIEFIKGEDQTEELQLMAIKQNGYAIYYCHNPSDKVMYEAVKNNGWVIRFIKPKYQTEELQLLAVQRYGSAIKFCHNPTYKVMYEAVKQNYNAIGHITKENQTEELQLLAVKQGNFSLNLCYNPSYEVMKTAIINNGYAIGFIKPEEQTEELQLLAVENHHFAIDYCHNPSEKVKQLHRELWFT